MDDEIVTQLGLVLTQLRYTRRAMEDIERSTARYGSFTFAAALAAGPRWGEPPMFSGALRVYVVNIEDLAPGSGVLGFLEALIGGVGRAVGGFFGGLGGGTISAILAPMVIGDMAKLAASVDSILERLGIGKQTTPVPGAKPGEKQPPAAGSDLPTTLAALSRTFEAITPLFVAATTEGQEKPIETPANERWIAMLKMAHTTLDAIKHVVDGLIILIPLVIGALAWLIKQFDSIKLAFLELLQFILRNALLLRGVVMAVTLDTIAAAAGLAAKVLAIVSTMVTKILESIFKIIGAVLTVVIEALRQAFNAVRGVVNALTTWISGPLMELLDRIANSLLFRFLMHLIRVLPAVLPPLYELVREKGDKAKGIPESPALTQDQLDQLSTAAGMTLPRPRSTTATAVTTLDFPDLGAEVTTALGTLPTVVEAQGKVIQEQAKNVFDTAGQAILDLKDALQKAADDGEKRFNEQLSKHIKVATETADKLTGFLTPVIEKARADKEKRETGLELIAHAYEKWVDGGGLDLVLKNVDEHFKAHTTVPEGIVAGARIDEKVPVTVEIGDVIFEIAPLEKPAAPGKPTSMVPGEAPYGSSFDELEQLHELRERGGDVLADGPLFGQLHTAG